MEKYHGTPLNKLMFPGAILHVLWRFLICKVFSIPINEIDFFNSKMNSSYIIHEKSDNKLFNLTVTLVPSFLNLILGSVLIILPSIEFRIFKLYSVIIDGGFSWATPIDYIVILFATWVGFSLLVHSVPSGKEAYMLLATVYDDIDHKYKDRLFIGSPYIANLGILGIVIAIVSFFAIPFIIGVFI